jgi:hypothetical protein
MENDWQINNNNNTATNLLPYICMYLPNLVCLPFVVKRGGWMEG